MRIYLAGGMRGIPDFNFPAFHAAAARLRAEGHVVFNPAEKDLETFGDKASSPTGNEKTFARKVGMTPMELRRAVFFVDVEWICRNADAIYLLPGWQASKGATAERALGIALGLEIVELAA
jgi:hypothetical protein